MPSSRNDRQRTPRRRGFDDDDYSSRAGFTPMPSFAVAAPEQSATVKWYNAEKGFGFVELADGSGDAFLHVKALQPLGLEEVSPGATLRVSVGQGQKGRQVQQVVSVDESTAAAQAPRRDVGRPRSDRPTGPRRPADLSNAVEMTGAVKWYNPEKGFGFISPQDGGKDVFVHASALERAGLSNLQDGQMVRMQVVQGAKGPEVGSLEIA
ncbi:cold-shock protein [Pseudoroseomonas globiformis]|uniref:Cold-shock protein n=1 Tax=Teichococcus globiformis TaxID=2307229 RepID=A0ABV7FYI8_9PROT